MNDQTKQAEKEEFKRYREKKIIKRFIKFNINEKLQEIYYDRIDEIIDFMSTENSTPKELIEIYDDLNIKEIHVLLKVYYGMPYNDWKKFALLGISKKEWYAWYAK